MLDYKLLEALAAVAGEGGFEKAAKKLFITQSAVSQRIKQLEDRAGQVLLARTAPPRPTSYGKRIIKHYLQVKRLEDELLGESSGEPGEDFAPLALGINADSLATWFMEAISPFLLANRVLLDLHIDDQEQTHKLLRDGEVVGCVSTRERPMQGCRCNYLGLMNYRLVATPEFAARWFPKGLVPEDALRAPIMVFNRKDELQERFLDQVLDKVPAPLPSLYVPSSESFAGFIKSGVAYGMVPDQQSSPHLQDGRLVDLAPERRMEVRLYWHCWNLKSALLDKLTRTMVDGAKVLLEG